MTKKMKLVKEEWDNEEKRQRFIKLRKNKNSTSFMSMIELSKIQPWERNKKKILKKKIKREIFLNKKKNNLISNYINFMEKVDKNFKKLKEITNENLDLIVENFDRRENQEKEVRKRREELRDEVEAVQRNIDVGRLKILRGMDKIGENIEKDRRDEIEKKEIEKRNDMRMMR